MTIQYIRFLKPPPTECLIGQHFTIVWTIESDLGDQTYWETVPVIISLQGSPQLGLRELTADPKIKSKKKAVFKPYAQTKPGLSTDVPVVFDPMRGGGIVTQLVIEQLPGKPVEIGQQVSIQLCLSLAPVVRSEPTSHPVWHEAYQFQSSLWIVPAWSCPILTTAAKQRHREVSESSDQAERWIKLPKQRQLQIKEDAVQSIARHVWDCGLGMCQFLFEQAMDTVFDEVVELGSGTGLVGIYAAELLKTHHVYLTDLPDALEIMQQNIVSQDKLSVRELAWGGKRDEDYSRVNLVLLTDVLYNQSSHDVLLETLDWLLDNKDCKALLAFKERNPDEREFFVKVESRGWQCERVLNQEHLVCEIYWIQKNPSYA